jgi:arylamine N-acetyltransferase
VLQYQKTEGWLELYALEPRPVQPVDIEIANGFTLSHRESILVKTRTVQRITPEARYALRGRTLSVARAGDGGVVEVGARELGGEELDGVPRELFPLTEEVPHEP